MNCGLAVRRRRWAAGVALLLIRVWITPPLRGAVIFTDLPDVPVFQGDLFPARHQLDANSDGSFDIEFYAHDDTFRVITTASTQVFALPSPPPNQGSYLNPFSLGGFIGADTTPAGYNWLGGSSAFYSCALFGQSLVCLGFWGNGPAYLGFRTIETDGFHYGYITVDTPFLGIHGGYIRDFAYETSPDTSIIAGVIPEPSTAVLVGTGTALLWKRNAKTRKENKSAAANRWGLRVFISWCKSKAQCVWRVLSRPTCR